MKNIHELEEDLYKRWLKSYPDDEQKEFCFDGLCYNGKISSDGKNASPGDEEELWNNTGRRILFLMKDTNNNSDSDYREWHWRNISHKFFQLHIQMAGRIVENKQRFYPHNGKRRLCNRTQCCCYEISACHSQHQKVFRDFIRLKQNIVRICKQGQGFLTGADT